MAPFLEKSWPRGKAGCLERNCLLLQGGLGGAVAGVSFIVFETAVDGLLYDRFFRSMRMIAAMLLGADALNDWFLLFPVLVTGMFLLALFAIAFGALFGFLIYKRPGLALTPRRLVSAGAAYGCLLWIVNLYLIAPVMGWSWFAFMTHPVLQGFTGYTFCYGAVLGGFMSSRQSARAQAGRQAP